MEICSAGFGSVSGWFERAAVVIACTSLLLAGQAIAQEVSQEGYPEQPRQAGTPTSPDQDFDKSFPKRDSLIPPLRKVLSALSQQHRRQPAGSGCLAVVRRRQTREVG